MGIITNGVSFYYAADAVKDLGLTGRAKVLRLGFSNPLPQNMIADFLKGCDKVLVVEEGEPFMEEAVKAIAQELGITIPIKGKSDGLFSRLFEFDPAMVRNNMAAFFDVAYTPKTSVDTSDVPEIPMRPPNLCSGCSHRPHSTRSSRQPKTWM